MVARRPSCTCRLVRAAMLLAFVGGEFCSAAEVPTDAELHSALWWHDRAAQYCAAIDDPAAQSDAYYKLAYESGHANDLTTAAAEAGKITAPQKGIYALTFVAKRYHEHGDDPGGAPLLKAARQLAESSGRKLTNFAYSALIPAMVELGMVYDAREYVASIGDKVQRDMASRDLFAALATHDLLDEQKAELSESDWNAIAYAYARAGRIDEMQSALKHVNTEQSHDRFYAALVDSLVTSKKWAEAEPLIDKITSPHAKAQSQERYSRGWAHEQPAEVIQGRLDQASSRAEKVALYDELVAKLATTDRVDEIESAIKAAIKAIQDSPQPVFVSKFGQFDDALSIAKEKSNYVITAKILSRQGKQDAAQERMRFAEESLRGLPPEAGMGTMLVLVGIVGTKIELGDLTGARRSVDDANPPFRGLLSSQVAKAYAKAGDAAGALEVAQEINSDRKTRGHSLGEVAAEFARRGDIANAQKLLASLEGTGDDAEAYQAVGKAMTEAGKADQLYPWLAEMPHGVDKAFACIGAAEVLRKSESH